MDLGIAGKTALVMGASKGIGEGIARQLAREGCRIVGVARNPGPLEQAMAGIRAEGSEATAVAADLTDRHQVASVFEAARAAFGDPEIVIFNPPTPRASSFLRADEAAYKLGFEELVHSFARVVRTALPAMERARWGRIVTCGSATVRQPMRVEPGSFGYAVANTGRLAAASLARNIANEVAHLGITVNTIATGPISTDTAREFYAARAAEQGVSEEEFNQLRLANIPMGREGTVEEIAGLAAFLCSQQAGFTTGDTVLCEGGFSNTPI